ncbi:MAG: Ig-like domain-containing protein, partial [Candidatus Subteraquimicrobiales bacterium]|nr:Ig-like domain-containing protein [Candidatus Subteraquimicrobiales bacterium]
ITLTRDEPGTTYYQWDGTAGPWTTYSGAFNALEGQHTLYYYSVDSANNTETTKNLAFKVDTTSPTSAITDPTANAYIGGSRAITGTATDTNFQKYDLEYGAGASPTTWYDIGTNPHTVAISNGTLDTWNTTTVSDGVYTIKVTTTDLAGNTSSVSVTVNVDNTPPTVASVDPANGSVGVANAANVYATFSESMTASTITTTTFTLYDDTAGSSVGGTVTYDNATKTATFDPTSDLITDHNYTATITTGVKDLAGRNMAANYVWSFSTRPPQIPSGLAVRSGDLKNRLTWNLNPESNVKYKIYRSTTETGTYTLIHTTAVGETSYNDTGYGARGYYWYRISAIDTGTLNESSMCTAKQNALVAISKSVIAADGGTLNASNAEVDLTIPAGALSANATITVDETTTPPAGAPLVSGCYEIKLGGATLSSNATLTIKYSTSNPTSSLYVAYWNGTSWEGAGGTVNEAASTMSLNTTTFGAGKYYAVGSDTTPPTAPATCDASQYPPTSIQVTWTAASDPETGISQYKIYRGVTSPPGILAGTVSGGTTSYIDSSGMPGETYYYAVSAVNGAGLEGAKSPEDSETVPGAVDPHRNY